MLLRRVIRAISVASLQVAVDPVVSINDNRRSVNPRTSASSMDSDGSGDEVVRCAATAAAGAPRHISPVGMAP